MYGSLAFQPSPYGFLHQSFVVFEPDEKGKPSAGAPGGTFTTPQRKAPKDGFPCIKKGADDTLSGGAVSAVEIALGFSPPRGVFDDGLDRAVRQFQSDNGLDADGIVGPVTGTKLGLKFQNCTRKIETTAAPIDDPGGEPGALQRLNIRRQTDPILFYGTIGVVVLLAAGGYAVYRNERGR